jgi:serine/threonine protein kinase
MHCAMQDEKYLYFLMDLLPGGELMDLLERKASLPEVWIRFYAASVSLV